MKIFFFLLFVFIFITVYANLFFVFSFDENYFPNISFSINSDSSLIINEKKLNNTFFLITFDVFLKKNIYSKPSNWNHQKHILSFETNRIVPNNSFSFADYFDKKNQYVFSEKRMVSLAYSSINNKLLKFLIQFDKNNPYTYTLLDSIYLRDDKLKNNIRLLFDYYRYNNQKKYFKAYLKIKKLYKEYPADKDIFSIYIYSLMDNGMFYQAKNEINKFFINKEKNDFYYSLFVNLYAISAKFDKSERILLKGRNLFPESKILLNDAINLYSVIDTVKAKKYMNILNNLNH